MTAVFGVEQPTTAHFEMCRTVGHAWDQFFPLLPAPQWGWRFALRCTRCTTERHDLISPKSGELVSRKYAYVEGYQIERGADRPTMTMLRESVFIRLREELVERHQIAVETTKRAKGDK